MGGGVINKMHDWECDLKNRKQIYCRIGTTSPWEYVSPLKYEQFPGVLDQLQHQHLFYSVVTQVTLRNLKNDSQEGVPL